MSNSAGPARAGDEVEVDRTIRRGRTSISSRPSEGAPAYRLGQDIPHFAGGRGGNRRSDSVERPGATMSSVNTIEPAKDVDAKEVVGALMEQARAAQGAFERPTQKLVEAVVTAVACDGHKLEHGE